MGVIKNEELYIVDMYYNNTLINILTISFANFTRKELHNYISVLLSNVSKILSLSTNIRA